MDVKQCDVTRQFFIPEDEPDEPEFILCKRTLRIIFDGSEKEYFNEELDIHPELQKKIDRTIQDFISNNAVVPPGTKPRKQKESVKKKKNPTTKRRKKRATFTEQETEVMIKHVDEPVKDWGKLVSGREASTIRSWVRRYKENGEKEKVPPTPPPKENSIEGYMKLVDLKKIKRKNIKEISDRIMSETKQNLFFANKHATKIYERAVLKRDNDYMEKQKKELEDPVEKIKCVYCGEKVHDTGDICDNCSQKGGGLP